MTILICVLILMIYESEKRKLFGREKEDDEKVFNRKGFNYRGYVPGNVEISKFWKVLFLGFILCSFVLYFS